MHGQNLINRGLFPRPLGDEVVDLEIAGGDLVATTRSGTKTLDLAAAQIPEYSRTTFGSSPARAGDRILARAGGTVTLPAGAPDDTEVLVTAIGQPVTIMPLGGATAGGIASQTVGQGKTIIFKKSGNDWTPILRGGEQGFMARPLAP